MLALRPKLNEILDSDESRTATQLEEMGVELRDGMAVEISLASIGSTQARRLLGAALLDYVLRLDPLVSEVRIEGFEQGVITDLGQRLPFERLESGSGQTAGCSVKVGCGSGNSDLVIDADGWLVSLGQLLEQSDEAQIFNPIGPLAAAALGAGEVFKALFCTLYDDVPYAKRFSIAAGVFSFFDYQENGANPPISEVEIDAHLIGLGGVGAGFVQAIGGFGKSITGQLRLVDPDVLEMSNVNRVIFGSVTAAESKDAKVRAAKAYLESRAPNLDVTEHQEWFDSYRESIAATRAERRYDVIVTGVDNDEVRHEVQRELPRILIDGATGRDLNCVVERVCLGVRGCLGCTRQTTPPARPAEDGEGCGNVADPRAPSVSFLSALPGILAAGELVKEAGGSVGSLDGAFNHLFIAGPNQDQLVAIAPQGNCRIECSNPGVITAYEAKYAA